MRYLSQRYSMPFAEAKGLLTDIGTEELGHMEMVAAIVHQLTRNLSDEDVRNNSAFAPYFVDHTTGVYPTAASGFPWTAGSIQSTGDPIADLTEDLAADAAIAQAQPHRKNLVISILCGHAVWGACCDFINSTFRISSGFRWERSSSLGYDG